MNKKRFILTNDHIKLVRNFIVGWQDCEFGAPEIDPKRPYGNSSVEYDIAEILGWRLKKDAEGDRVISEVQEEQARQIHSEMKDVLQIILVTGKFKAGKYERDEYNTNWKKIKSNK